MSPGALAKIYSYYSRVIPIGAPLLITTPGDFFSISKPRSESVILLAVLAANFDVLSMIAFALAPVNFSVVSSRLALKSLAKLDIVPIAYKPCIGPPTKLL